MTWRPIESAPKDGTRILICGGEPGYGWDGDDRDGGVTPPAVVAQFLINAQRWQFAWYDSGYYGEWSDPTHWMPLPAPPAGIDE